MKKKISSVLSRRQEFQLNLPPYHSKLGELKKILCENRALSLLLIDSSNLNQIETGYGKKDISRHTKAIESNYFRLEREFHPKG